MARHTPEAPEQRYIVDVRQFLGSQCYYVPNAREARTTNQALYRAHCAWAKQQGKDTPTRITFGRVMREMGYASDHGGRNIMFWPGIVLRDKWRQTHAG